MKHVSISEQPGNLSIKLNWFRWFYLPTLLLLWILCAVFFAAAFLPGEHLQTTSASWFPQPRVAFFLGGFAILYPSLLLVLNKTHIKVCPNLTEVKFSPLPFLGSSRISTRDIERFVVVVAPQRRRFSLEAILKNGSKHSVSTHVKGEKQAKFLESKLNGWLQAFSNS